MIRVGRVNSKRQNAIDHIRTEVAKEGKVTTQAMRLCTLRIESPTPYFSGRAAREWRGTRRTVRGRTMGPYNGFTGEQRARAQRWINQQLAAGKLLIPSHCCACVQTTGRIDFHAEDYGEPFGTRTVAYPLCFLCHMMLHRRFKCGAAWDAYRAAVREGKQYAAAFGFGDVQRLIHGDNRPYLWLRPPRVLVLDAIHEGGAPSPEAPRLHPVRLVFAPFA